MPCRAPLVCISLAMRSAGSFTTHTSTRRAGTWHRCSDLRGDSTLADTDVCRSLATAVCALRNSLEGDTMQGSIPDEELPSEDDVRKWFNDLSNWGRWGADDRLGTLNLITPEK